MRYIKLFEGFGSKNIASLLSFLDKKIGKAQYNSFLSEIKNITKYYDIELNKIDDTHIKYLTYKKAISIDNEKLENSSITSGVYCIKYWFSLNGGFLGQTAVGDKKMNFEDSGLSNGFINRKMMDYAKRNFNIGGTLKKVTKYSELESGDKVLFFQNNINASDNEVTRSFSSFICFGNAYKFDNELFIFNNEFNHLNISSQESETFRTRIRGGRYNGAIKLGNVGEELIQKHVYLLNYDAEDDELNLAMTEENENSKFWNYNLPFSRYYDTSRIEFWDIDKSLVFKKIQDAEFAIVLYLYDIVNTSDKREVIRKERKLSKENTLALIDNEDYKSANFDRYLKKIFDKHDFGNIDGNFNNMSNLVTNVSKLILIEDNSFKCLKNLSEGLESMLNTTNVIDRKNQLERISNYYMEFRRLSKMSDGLDKKRIEIDKCVNEYVKSILIKILDLGVIINELLSKSEINDVYDLTVIVQKLKMIKKLDTNSLFSLSYMIRNYRQKLIKNDDINYWLNNSEYDENDFKYDNKKLEKMEVAIRKILK